MQFQHVLIKIHILQYSTKHILNFQQSLKPEIKPNKDNERYHIISHTLVIHQKSPTHQARCRSKRLKTATSNSIRLKHPQQHDPVPSESRRLYRQLTHIHSYRRAAAAPGKTTPSLSEVFTRTTLRGK